MHHKMVNQILIISYHLESNCTTLNGPICPLEFQFMFTISNVSNMTDVLFFHCQTILTNQTLLILQIIVSYSSMEQLHFLGIHLLLTLISSLLIMIMQATTQSFNSMKEDARPLNRNLSRDYCTNIPIEYQVSTLLYRIKNLIQASIMTHNTLKNLTMIHRILKYLIRLHKTLKNLFIN